MNANIAIRRIKMLMNNFEHVPDFKEFYFESLEKAIDVLGEEIIHCIDCKHNNAPRNSGNAECTLFYGMNDQFGFCHYAKMREMEGNE